MLSLRPPAAGAVGRRRRDELECGAGSSKDSFVAACGYGETGIGASLEGNHGVVGGVGVWTIGLSLLVRAPAAGGVIFGFPHR